MVEVIAVDVIVVDVIVVEVIAVDAYSYFFVGEVIIVVEIGFIVY